MSIEQKFYFGMVANGTSPIAEYAVDSENYLDLGLEILEMVNHDNPYTISNKDGKNYYCYTNKNKITFFCVCDDLINEETRNRFLKDLEVDWIQQYGNEEVDFDPYSKDDEFGEVAIKRLIDIYNDPDKIENLMKIKCNMYKVLKVTMNNIELALMRSDNTDDQIQELSERLQNLKSKMDAFSPEDISYFEKNK